MKQRFDVLGMTCSACSAHVEKAVNKLDGVNKVSVSLLTNSMTVDFDGKTTSVQAIIAAVEKSGYGASVKGNQPDKEAKPVKQKPAVTLVRTLVSIGFCIVLMYVSMGHMVGLPLPSFLEGAQNAVSFALVQFLLCLPVWYINRSYFIVGFKRLFQLSPNMDSLIAVGSFAGALYGVIVMFITSSALGRGDIETVEYYRHLLYFESSAMILALVDLGKYFEGRSKIKTGDALNKLKKLAPQTAIALIDGEEREIDVKAVKVGDIVIVKAGMAFPADGNIISGSCFADESSVNGESLPREKQQGDFVIGGTVSVSGYVQVEVTSVGQDSILSKIIQLVEDAGSSKAPSQRLADKISSLFVPIVMSISLVTFIVWLCVGKPFSMALDFAVSVLVISCPCALGLATPVAIMVSTGKSAEHGILIKDGETLERLAAIKQVVLDKTGTLTLGKPNVVDSFSSMDESKFYSIVGGIEKLSEHPLGRAVVDKAERLGIELCVPSSYETLAGRGVTATVEEHFYCIGNLRLMTEYNVDCTEFKDVYGGFYDKGLTCLHVSCDGKYIGVIGVGDEIKPTSFEAVNRLKALGVKPVLLTGDNELAAKAVASQVGIDDYRADVMPADKEKVVAELMKDGVTAMVGDGINDAPALTRADVGFAVSSGADIAMDSADALLMKNDIRDVPYAIELSRATRRNIKQNLFWAFFYNTLGIPIAAGVLFITPLALSLNPMIGAAAMSVSSLFVVLNALRLRVFKPSKHLKYSHTNAAETAAKPICSDKACGSAKCRTESILQHNNCKKCKEESKMKYQLKIEGMMCMRCVSHVTNALLSVDGVDHASADLQNGTADVSANADVTAESLKNAVEAQDYTVTEVKAI